MLDDAPVMSGDIIDQVDFQGDIFLFEKDLCVVFILLNSLIIDAKFTSVMALFQPGEQCLDMTRIIAALIHEQVEIFRISMVEVTPAERGTTG